MYAVGGPLRKCVAFSSRKPEGVLFPNPLTKFGTSPRQPTRHRRSDRRVYVIPVHDARSWVVISLTCSCLHIVFFTFDLSVASTFYLLKRSGSKRWAHFPGGGGDRRRGPKRHSVRVRRSTRAFVVARKMVLRNASGSVPLQKFH